MDKTNKNFCHGDTGNRDVGPAEDQRYSLLGAMQEARAADRGINKTQNFKPFPAGSGKSVRPPLARKSTYTSTDYASNQKNGSGSEYSSGRQ